MYLMRIVSAGLAALVIVALLLNMLQSLRYGPELPSGTMVLASMSESGLKLPLEEVEAAFESARATMFARNRTGSWFAVFATGATWFNVLCSIIITVALGWAGKSVTPADATNKEILVGLPPKWAKVIGFAAALAGASAFAGNEAKQYAEQRYESARQLHSLISDTQRVLEGSPDETSQREALDNLSLEAQKP